MIDVLELVTKYGLKAVIIAVAAILMIGLVKVVLKKQLQGLGKEKCKALYEALSIAIVALSIVLYHVVAELFGYMEVTFDWKVMAGEAMASWAVVKILYPLYENFGIRKLLQTIGAAILTSKKKVTKAEEKPRVAQKEEPKDTTIVL